MESLFKIFKTLIIFIWLVDIMNIDFIVGNFSLANFLDSTFAINGWFWFWFWCLMPGFADDITKITVKKELKEDE